MERRALPVLRTPRLTLDALTPEDAPALVAGVGNLDVSKWLSQVPYPYRLTDAESWIAEQARGDERNWALRHDGLLIGVMGLAEELGYWLGRPYWGQGFATEAGQAIVDQWFSDPQAGVLSAGYFSGNDGSGRVLEKLGFEVVGTGQRQARALAQKLESVELRMSRARWEARRKFRVTTERLVLRELRPEDAGALHRIMRQERVTRNLARWTHPITVAQVADHIRDTRFTGAPPFLAGITRRGRLIGIIGIGRDGDFGYAIDPDRWGKGYATEAAAGLLSALRDRYGVSSVAADHFADNPASGEVLMKLGFKRVGEGLLSSAARLEPAPGVLYRLEM